MEKKYLLVNVAEELVKREVRERMAAFDMCRCEKCFMDVCAIVLNKLDPHYVTTEKGSLFTLLDATHYQYKIDLEVCVLQAMKLVKETPRD